MSNFLNLFVLVCASCGIIKRKGVFYVRKYHR
nr:MAG TPA: RING domain protein [Caudoviricetes sp.]